MSTILGKHSVRLQRGPLQFHVHDKDSKCRGLGTRILPDHRSKCVSRRCVSAQEFRRLLFILTVGAASCESLCPFCQLAFNEPACLR